MSRFVVVVFPDEAKAYQATGALNELHAEGSLTLYGTAVITKDANGGIAVKQAADVGPLGTAVGALVGGLVGLAGGPAVALAGVTGGVLIGGLIDMVNYGVGEDFVAKVSNELGRGKTAVVAEIAEDWTAPLDARMESLGGMVLRTWRADFEDEQIVTEVAARKADFEQLRLEYAQASAEAKAKLKAKVDKAKQDLKDAEKRLEAKIDSVDKELNAKISALEKQIADAEAGAKEKIKKRIAALRTDYEARSAKLKQAWALTKEALAA